MDYSLSKIWIKLPLQLVVITTYLTLSLSAPAQNQRPAPLSETDVDEVHELIDFYFLTFSEGDFERFATVFSVPYYMPRNPLIDSVDQIVDRYRGFRQDAIDDNPNYQASIASRIKVVPLWFGGVLAQVHWQRLSSENELIVEAAEVMFIMKQNSEWKIAGLLPMDLREWDKEYELSSSEALLDSFE